MQVLARGFSALSLSSSNAARVATPSLLCALEMGSGDISTHTSFSSSSSEVTSEETTASPALSDWAPGLKRTGLLAVKLGMTQAWDSWGQRLPLTVLRVDSNQVLEVKTPEKHGYSALVLGAGSRKLKRTTLPALGNFMKAGVAPKALVREFRADPAATGLPVGYTLSAAHFVPGQTVDVVGVSVGKGFQGGMKRWGFAGLGASHGVSKAHRSIGSTGQRKFPGKVFKGKKMPGHMGARRVTQQGLSVYKIDPEEGLIFIHGSVPGHAGSWVEVRDAVKPAGKAFTRARSDPPVPTWVPGTHNAEDWTAPAGDNPWAGDES